VPAHEGSGQQGKARLRKRRGPEDWRSALPAFFDKDFRSWHEQGGKALLQEIRTIYEYHDWANHQVLDAAGALTPSELNADIGGSFSTFMKTLTHILCVERLFIRRWRELPPLQAAEWETIGQIRDAWLSLEAERNEFLRSLDEARLAEPIHYSDTRGRAVTLELWQAVFQCTNHSTFHRGQLIEKLRHLDTIPPTTDFVAFCRSVDK
jgi:uncharacterized damage-inducible protein DinB